jgi:hypothetical protein
MLWRRCRSDRRTRPRVSPDTRDRETLFRPWTCLQGGHGAAVVSVSYHRAGFSPWPKTMTSHVAQPEMTGEDAGTNTWHHHREERRDTSLTAKKNGVDPRWSHCQPAWARGRRPPMSADHHGCCTPQRWRSPRRHRGPHRPAMAQIGPSHHV